MSLTRKMLKAMGIEEEKIEQIIDAHSETVEALKSERDSLKENAESVEDLKTKLSEAERRLAEDDYKAKYETVKKQYDDFVEETEAKALLMSKTEKYKSALKEAGVSEKRIDTIIKVSDVGAITLDESGNIVEAESFINNLKTEWSDFIETGIVQGANVPTPSGMSCGITADEFNNMSLSERMAYANEHPNEKLF